MRRSSILALACLALLLGACTAQEDCSAEVSAAVSPVQKKLDDASAQYAELYKTWQKQGTEIEALKSSVAELTGQLAAAKEAAKSKPKLDLPTIAVAVVDLTKDAALAAWGEAKAIFEELKGGKTTKLEALVASTLSTFRGAASSAVAFVRKEADEHLPEGVKKQLAQGAAQAQALWKQHVTDAAWAQPLIAQFKVVNAEVTKVVTTTLTSTPALAPLADPVTVQLVVVAVFALPGLLLLLVVLTLLGGKKKPSAVDTRPGASKKKKPAKRA